MDVSGTVELYANRRARQVSPVRLTGNYGGDVLRGLVAFKPTKVCERLLDPEFAGWANRASATYMASRQGRTLSFILFKQMPWHHYGRFTLEQSQLTLRSPYLDNDLISLVYQAPADSNTDNRLSLGLVEEVNPSLSRIPTDRGVLHRPIPILTWAAQLYETFAFKAEYAYDHGMPQWLARIDHLVAPARPERLFLGRHKFYHFRTWYWDQLSDYVRDVLLDFRTRSRPYFQGTYLEAIVKAHLGGYRNYTREIHQALTSELIQRHLIEQN